MLEKLKKNKQGWYAVGGAFAVMFAMVAVYLMQSGGISTEHGEEEEISAIGSGILPMVLAIIGAFISIASLFCGSKKQRDGIFVGLFFAHFLMAIFGAALTGMEMNIPLLLSYIVLFVVAITMDSVYLHVGFRLNK